MEAKRPLNETSQRWNLNPRWKRRQTRIYDIFRLKEYSDYGAFWCQPLKRAQRARVDPEARSAGGKT